MIKIISIPNIKILPLKKILEMNYKMNMEILNNLRNQLYNDIIKEYHNNIEITEDKTVTGQIGEDKIVDCLKLTYHPINPDFNNVVDEWMTKYCRINNINLMKDCLVRSVCNGMVKYSLVYVTAPCNCGDCRYRCKHNDLDELHYCDFYQPGEDL